MVKHTQTIRRLLPTNCLSVFNYFVGLALKGLNKNKKRCEFRSLWIIFRWYMTIEISAKKFKASFPFFQLMHHFQSHQLWHKQVCDLFRVDNRSATECHPSCCVIYKCWNATIKALGQGCILIQCLYFWHWAYICQWITG